MSYPNSNPYPIWKEERNKDWRAVGMPNFETFAATWKPSKDVEPKLLLTKAYRRYLASKEVCENCNGAKTVACVDENGAQVFESNNDWHIEAIEYPCDKCQEVQA